MHISIVIRGYESEKELINIVKKRLEWLVREDIPEEIEQIIGYEKLKEDEETVAHNFQIHLYPNSDAERFYLY